MKNFKKNAQRSLASKSIQTIDNSSISSQLIPNKIAENVSNPLILPTIFNIIYY